MSRSTGRYYVEVPILYYGDCGVRVSRRRVVCKCVCTYNIHAWEIVFGIIYVKKNNKTHIVL